MKRCYALALILAFAAAPCSAGAASGPPSAASAITVTPAHVSQAVAALDSIVQDLQRSSGVPGIAIAVVHGDRVVYLKGFGVRKVGMSQRVDADTVFELASVSKPVGAAVIAGAVGRGVVKWTDPVQKYLPWFALSDPYVSRTVTIGDMYAHRSGLPDHAGDLLEDLGYDRSTILKRLALEPLDPFRITYHYTNFGITAAAEAVAQAEHTSWEDLSQQILYGPLGMTSTSSRYADYAKATDRAALHVRVGNKWLPKFTRDADAESPAGGVSSSARDMAQWLRFELANGKYDGKPVVSEEALLATRMPNLVSSPLATPESRASFYGFGIGVAYDEGGRLRLSHSGAFASGAATTIAILPSEKLGIVVLTNGMPVGVPESIAASFFDIVEFGKVQRDWYAAYGPLFAHLFVNPSPLAGKKPPSNPKPPRLFSGYVGSYANAYYGPLTISARNGRLVMQLGPRHQMFPLSHWDGNTFTYMPAGENAAGITRVVFIAAPGSSRSVKVIVDNLNESGLGTFGR
jgi:CubicO group peptidase (beta-lactamase class C family)